MSTFARTLENEPLLNSEARKKAIERLEVVGVVRGQYEGYTGHVGGPSFTPTAAAAEPKMFDDTWQDSAFMISAGLQG